MQGAPVPAEAGRGESLGQPLLIGDALGAVVVVAGIRVDEQRLQRGAPARVRI
jgi:hypothetical protein